MKDHQADVDVKNFNGNNNNNNNNLIKGIKAWAIPIVRYLRPFSKRTKVELKQMEQTTRKFRMMHKALHPREDVDRLDIQRKKGGGVHDNIEDSVYALIQRLNDFIKNAEKD